MSDQNLNLNRGSYQNPSKIIEQLSKPEIWLNDQSESSEKIDEEDGIFTNLQQIEIIENGSKKASDASQSFRSRKLTTESATESTPSVIAARATRFPNRPRFFSEIRDIARDMQKRFLGACMKGKVVFKDQVSGGSGRMLIWF